MSGRLARLILAVGAVLVLVLAAYLLLHQPQPEDSQPGGNAGATAGNRAARGVAFIGDSYTGGSPVGGLGSAGWPALLSAEHHWVALPSAVSGSGYTVGGPEGRPFVQRIPAVVAARPEIVLIWAARGDTDPLAVGPAAETVFRDLLIGLPDARVVVIGPAWIGGAAPRRQLALRDAEQAAARAAGLPFIDPLAEGWFSEDDTSLIGSDGVSPTDAGHRYLAGLIDRDLKRLGVT
jgi:hypothetical protein